MKSYLLKLTQYNVWANEKIVNCITKLNENQIDQELISSFPTIRKTLYHIWDAETIWMKRLNGESLHTWPSKDFKGNITEAQESFLNSSADFSIFLESKEDDFLEKKLSYTTIKRDISCTKASDMIIHCMNHSTYHRGQLVTMLRNVGFTDLPCTDYIEFVRNFEG